MVGPKGCWSSSDQNWPTITGLMNSGTIRIEHDQPAAAEALDHGQRQQQAEHELDRDACDRERIAVLTSDQARDRVGHDLPEILQPDEGVAGDLEVVVHERHPDRVDQRVDRERQDQEHGRQGEQPCDVPVAHEDDAALPAARLAATPFTLTPSAMPFPVPSDPKTAACCIGDGAPAPGRRAARG